MYKDKSCLHYLVCMWVADASCDSSKCGHYIKEEKFTPTNMPSTPCNHQHQELTDGPYHICRNCGAELPQ